jgi:DNA-binding transcriptional MerR regulator
MDTYKNNHPKGYLMASNELSLFAAETGSNKEKSPNALRTISEASELLDVPQHVLRFWETKFTQIKPLKRNGGRRFYRPQDLEILQQIKHLLYAQGYTIKGAQKAITDFALSRSKDSAPVDRWATPSFPPAHGNDNAESFGSGDIDILAEIADILAEPAPAPLQAPASEPSQRDRAALMALRQELASMRDELAAKIRHAV